jgi:hypothetical protein
LARQTRLTIYKTLIRPVLLYGSKEGAPHDIWYNKIVDGVYRSRYNFEFDTDFNNPNVIGVVL